MREAAFVKKNRDRWVQFEDSLKKSSKLSPDDLADLYLQLVNDLSFAKSYYPKSNITIYLNDLARKAHFFIYKNKKEKSNRIITFWKYEFPLMFAQYHKELLLSFLFFLLACAIGFFSVFQDQNFARIVMGNEYVDMTLENIKKGDPMAVYHRENEVLMFMYITFNNIRVGFYAFVSGLFTPLLTFVILFKNGIMLGSFDGFLITQGVGLRGNAIVWIHGVIEIFVIIVCGTAGLILGNSILFPKTYTRIQSLQKAASDGLKICFSTVPFFVCAGFLESFVTRHSLMPLWVAIVIICITLCIIIFYFIIYPIWLKKKFGNYEQLFGEI